MKQLTPNQLSHITKLIWGSSRPFKKQRFKTSFMTLKAVLFSSKNTKKPITVMKLMTYPLRPYLRTVPRSLSLRTYSRHVNNQKFVPLGILGTFRVARMRKNSGAKETLITEISITQMTLEPWIWSSK